MPKTKSVLIKDRQNYVRAFRKERGMTLIELGKAAKLSHASLSQFENDEANLSEAAWKRVVRALEQFGIEGAIKQAPKVPPTEPLLLRFLSASDWESLAHEYSRKLRRMWSWATQEEIAKAAEIPPEKLIPFEAREVEFTAHETERWNRAIRDAWLKNRPGTMEMDFHQAIAEIGAGNKDVLFRLTRGYYDRFVEGEFVEDSKASEAGHAPGDGTQRAAAMRFGELKDLIAHRKDFLARFSQDPDGLFAEAKDVLQDDIRQFEKELGKLTAVHTPAQASIEGEGA